jgi:hypothetical protein
LKSVEYIVVGSVRDFLARFALHGSHVMFGRREFIVALSIMDDPSRFFATSNGAMEPPPDETGTPRGGEDAAVEHPSHDEDDKEVMEESFSVKTPSNTTKTANPSYTLKETSPTNVAEYTDASVKDDGPPSKTTTDDDANATNGGPDPASVAEFDAIAREAALFLEKKLASNREWIEKLHREMTTYTNGLAEVLSEYNLIQRLEQEESARLDGVEPDVQGATSHLLEETPNTFGGDLRAMMVGHFISGGKRKAEQE